MKPTRYSGGISPEGAQEVSQRLDTLLSDYQIYHQNLRLIHWNNDLRLHFDLDEAIEPLYDSTEVSTHVLAQRIMDLGYQPTPTVSEALILSRLEPLYQVTTYEDAIQMVIQNSQELLQIAREVFDIAVRYEDERTMHLLTELGKYLHHTIKHFSTMRMARLN